MNMIENHREVLMELREICKENEELLMKVRKLRDRENLLSHFIYDRRSYSFYSKGVEITFNEKTGELYSYAELPTLKVPEDKYEMVRAILTMLNITGVTDDFSWGDFDTIEEFLELGKNLDLTKINVVEEDGTITQIDDFNIENIEELKKVYDRAFYENEIELSGENFFESLFEKQE